MEPNVWLPEPRVPSPSAVHMIVDAAGELVVLLAYIPPDGPGARLCGLETFGRRRPAGDFDGQFASGLTDNSSLDDAKALPLTMVKQPRDTWTILPRRRAHLVRPRRKQHQDGMIPALLISSPLAATERVLPPPSAQSSADFARGTSPGSALPLPAAPINGEPGRIRQ